MTSAVRRLGFEALEKPWGSPLTEPWFHNPEQKRIGEIWFASAKGVPLLIKLLFTSDKLSVQVHPGDEYAREHHHGSAGKTEMWHVLKADANAEVAIGLRAPVTRKRLVELCLNEEIRDHLCWTPAREGDTFFIPAGTIHAIGAGLVLCEVQQISDVTYRLYDWGRGRELHLEAARDVSQLHPYEGRCVPHAGLLAESPYFRTCRLEISGSSLIPPREKPFVYVAIAGQGSIGGEPFRAGEAMEIAPGPDPVEVLSSDATFVITSAP